MQKSVATIFPGEFSAGYLMSSYGSLLSILFGQIIHDGLWHGKSHATSQTFSVSFRFPHLFLAVFSSSVLCSTPDSRCCHFSRILPSGIIVFLSVLLFSACLGFKLFSYSTPVIICPSGFSAF